MKLISLIVSLICMFTPVTAQTAAGSWTLGPNWTYNRNMSNLELARIAMQGEINKRLLDGTSTKRSSKTKILAVGPTAFKSTGKYLLPEMISKQAEGSANERFRLKSSLEQSLRFYENIALLKEYPANDLSFALLYYVINNYVIYRNIDPAATDVSGKTQYLVGGFYSPLYDHEKALFNQLRTQLSKDKTVNDLNDEEKRKISEMLAIYTTLMWHQFQDLAQKRDMDGLGRIRSQAASNVEGFVGSEIGSIEVGSTGIVIRK